MPKPARRLVPDPEVCRRYSVHPTTLYNWDKNPKLGFPKPVRINNRKFRDENELDKFDRARAAERHDPRSPPLMDEAVFSIDGAGREETQARRKRKSTMDLSQYAGARYIRVEDLAGGPRRKIIANVELGQWDRPVLTFTDRSRLSLNGTNVNTLINVFGSTESEDLVDKEVELYAGPVRVQGADKIIVLVRASRPPPSKSVKEDLDDEIPFS